MPFSFNPAKAIEVGFLEGDYRILAAYSCHVSWARKDGTNPKSTPDSTVVMLELQNLNSTDPQAQPHLERYGVGSKESYSPSADNLNPLAQSPRQTSQDVIPPAERGNYIIGSDLTKNSKFFTFGYELGMCGFPTDRLDTEGLKALVGLEGHMINKGQEKKPGAIERAKGGTAPDREYTTPSFNKVTRLPWDGSAPAQAQAPATTPAASTPTSAPAAGKPAASSTPAPAADKATLKSAGKFLTKVLTADAKEDTSNIDDRTDLKKLLTKALMSADVEAAERNAIFSLALKPEFFNAVAGENADDIGATFVMKEDADGSIKRK